MTTALALALALTLLAGGSWRTARATAAGQPDAPQTVFTNSAPITINDADIASPYPSQINVTGLTGNIPATPGSIKVTLNGYSHTFSDDVGMVLVGPTGAAFLLQDAAGDDPDMTNVTYTLSDDGAAFLPDDEAWTAGTYKPSAYFTTDVFPAPGPGAVYNIPGPSPDGNATFASTFAGTNPNGAWKLYVADFVDGDDGAISGGWSLEINTGVTPTVTHKVLDFDGDNKTDYAVVRDSAGTLAWYLQRSTAGFAGQFWGATGDVVVPADYDGDGKNDLAVWRSGTFYILQSGSNALQVVSFGVAGDDPRITQDFDGDGKADPAVTRNVSGVLTWYILRSTAGFAAISFGDAANDYSIRGDFDGDQKADVAIYRRGTGAPQFTFFVLRSSDGGTQAANFGNSGVGYVVPGDFDGDSKTDYALWNGKAGAGGQWVWINSSNGAFNNVSFGAAGAPGISDLPVPGDYDGDNKTDQAVWRPSTGVFYVNGSTAGFIAVPFGATNDIPPAYSLQAR
jgi:subtilisin-like proprotein convertase family protein